MALQNRAARIARHGPWKDWLDEHSTTILTVAVCAIALGIVAFGASVIFAAREVDDAELARALQIRDNVEQLENLYAEADADFLRLVADPTSDTLPWPAARIERTERTLDALAQAFAQSPARRQRVDELRAATHEWQHSIDLTARGEHPEGSWVLLPRDTLLSVEDSRHSVAVGVRSLDVEQDLSAGARATTLARRYATERTAFAAAAAAAFVFLVYGFLANHRLGLERARARISAEEGEARFREYFEEHPLPMLIYDVETLTIAAINGAAVRQYGYEREELAGMSIAALRPAEDSAEFIASFIELASAIGPAGGSSSGSTHVRSHVRKDGSRFFVEPSYHFLTYANRRACFVVAIDVTEKESAKDLLAHQANFDLLTELPNRYRLSERLVQAIRDADRDGTRVAVVFMDIDHFKDVNDSLGHGIGDRLLREIGARLGSCVSAADTVARYGGDEFVIVVCEGAQEDRLAEVLTRVSQAFAHPVWIDDTEFHVESSIGVASFPSDGRDPETLLRRADLAMYRAKSNGRNALQHFTPELGKRADERLALSRRMRAALANGEFRLDYQPQVDLQANRVTGVEALLRWTDTELGPVSPATFIPIAEENGLIVPIGEWVMQQACFQAQVWQETLPGLRMSVNLSPRQFARADILRVVQHALTHASLSPRLLELEITEGALMTLGALDVLRALRAMDIDLAIDDFGTGYSSLSYIRNFHAERLKLDMSFVSGIGRHREDEVITRAILSLGRALGFQVVAEGVETDTQLSFLRLHGCSIVQGYRFARPMPAADAHAFIRHFNEGMLAYS